jgi:hypothetical protein
MMLGSGALRGVEFVPVAGEVFEVEGAVALGGIVALGVGGHGERSAERYKSERRGT